MIESKYMKFNEFQKSGRKTKTVIVLSKRGNDRLGIIEWYVGWRQYCWFPDAEIVMSKGCNDDINKVIDSLTTGNNKKE